MPGENYNLGIEVELKETKINQQLKKLGDKFEKLGKTMSKVNNNLNTETKKITRVIDEESKEYKELENRLEKVNKKKKELASNNNNLQKTVKKQSKEIDNLNKKLKDNGKETNKAKDANDSWLSSYSESLQIAIKSTAIWGGATTAIYGTKRALEEISTIIKTVNREMVELQKVMNPAITNFQEMKESAADLGVEFAKNIEDVVQGMVKWGRQGKEQIQVIELTKAALLASNVAEMDAARSVEYLTSAILQFNLDASEAIGVVDRLNETANNFATTATDLAESIKEAGSAANNAGVSIDSLIGMTTALTAATGKSGNRIGNALKTIFSRIRGDTNSTVESLGKVEQKLNEIGIAIRVNETTYRDLTNVLTDLSSTWDTLDGVMKDNIARAMGGRRRYSDVISLIENWDIAMDATTTSMNSMNSAVEENETYMESIVAQWAQARATFEQLALMIGDAGGSNVLIQAANYAQNLFKSSMNLVVGLEAIEEQTKKLSGALKDLKVILGGVATYFGYTLAASHPVIASITLMVSTITELLHEYGKYQIKLEEVGKDRKKLNNLTKRGNELSAEEIKNVGNLVDEYSGLIDEVSGLPQEIDKMVNEMNFIESGFFMIQDILPFGDSEIKKLEDKRKDIIETLRLAFPDLSEEYKKNEKFLNEANKALMDYQIALEGTNAYISKHTKEQYKMIEQHRREHHLLKEKVETYKKLTNAGELNEKQQVRLATIQEDLKKQFPELAKEGNNFADTLNTIFQESKKQYGVGGSVLENFIKQLEKNLDKLNNEVLNDLESAEQRYIDDIIKFEDKLKEIDKDTQSIDYNQVKEDLVQADNNLANVRLRMDEANQSIKEHRKWIEALNKEYDAGGIDNYIADLENLENPLDSLKEKFQDLQDTIADTKRSLELDLKEISLFGDKEGLSNIDKIEKEVKAYEKAQKSVKKIWRDLTLLSDQLDKENLAKKVEKQFETENLNKEQQNKINEIIGDLDPKPLENDIETAIFRIFDIIYTNWETQKDNLQKKINFREVLNFYNNEDLDELTKKELKGFIEDVNKVIEDGNLGNVSLDKLDIWKGEADFQLGLIDELESLKEIDKTLSKISDREFFQEPILTDDRFKDKNILKDSILSQFDDIVNKDLSDLGTNELEEYIKTLNKLPKVIEHLDKKYDVDLSILFDKEEISKQKELSKEQLEILKNYEKEYTKATERIQKRKELKDTIFSNMFPEKSKLEKEVKDALDVLQQALNEFGYGSEEASFARQIFMGKAGEYRDFNIMEELGLDKSDIDSRLKNININEIIGIEEAKDSVKEIKDMLSELDIDIEKITSSNLTKGQKEDLMEEYGLTENEMKNLLKKLRGYVKDTKYAWAEAITGGLENAFSNINSSDSFTQIGNKMGRGLLNGLLNFNEGKKRVQGFVDEYAGTVTDYLNKKIPHMNLDEEFTNAGMMSAISQYAGGRSLGGSALSGLGTAMAASGNPLGYAVSGLSSVGESIFGGDEGESQSTVQALERQVESAKNYLSDFNLDQLIPNVKSEDRAGFFDRLFGGTDIKIFNKEQIENSIEKVKGIINDMSGGIESTLKNAFTMNTYDFQKSIEESLGTALQNALINSIMDQAFIKEAMGSVTKVITQITADGQLTNSEIERYENAIADAKEQFNKAKDMADELIDVPGLEQQVDNSQSFQAGTTSTYNIDNSYIVQAGAFMGTEEEAETFASFISKYIREDLERDGYI